MILELNKNELDLLKYAIMEAINNEKSYNIIYDLEELLDKLNCEE